MLRKIGVLFVCAMMLGVASAGAQNAPATECDSLAGHPNDPQRKAPGLTPDKINAAAAVPACEAAVRQYPNDVRYFWARLEDVRALREGIKGCVGANSYVVFLFSNRGLFRISWRLPPDASCPSPSGAALDLYARYLSLDGAAAVATHYRANKTEAVEITDPGAGYLMPFRWENRQRR